MRRLRRVAVVALAVAIVTGAGAAPASAEGGVQIVPYFLPVATTLTVVTPGGFEPQVPQSDVCYLGGATGNADLILTANAEQTETYAFVSRGDASGTIQAYGDFPGVGLVTISLIVSACGPGTPAEIAQLIADDLPYVAQCGSATRTASAHPVHQHTTPMADGSCNITDPGYDWSGASSGGWTRSWAQWPNGGAGGAVCARTLVYSDALGHWTVESSA